MENFDSPKLSYAEAAHFIGVPIGTLYAWVKRQQIPHLRLGPRLVRFCRQDLEVWLRERAIPASGNTQPETHTAIAGGVRCTPNP